MPESFTKTELRNSKANTVAYPQAQVITIKNDIGSNYLTLESVDKENSFFDKHIISKPIRCSVTVNNPASQNASIIVEPYVTASITLTPLGTLAAGKLRYRATNPLFYSDLDPTSSGSVLGMDISVANAP